MSQNTNKNLYKNHYGFTLVELLIAIAIFGIISVISVQGLYDIVSIRAKQQTIEDSSDTFRVVARLITKSVLEADTISIPDTKDSVQTTNEEYCATIKYDSVNGSVLYKSNPGPACTSPTPDSLTTNDSVTNEDFLVTSFSLSPPGTNTDAVLLEMEGDYKNSLGDHPINYSTTIARRN